MSDFWIAGSRNRPKQPWGEAPPPEPSDATDGERLAVAEAWSAWSHFRPYYRRTGELVECEVDLKGNVFAGKALIADGRSESETYWLALQDCIGDWLDGLAPDVNAYFDGTPRASGALATRPPAPLGVLERIRRRLKR